MSIISDSNEQQQKAITHGEGPQLIVAGAGTGKTRVITTRIAWLITEKNLNVDEVLSLTFTEKAAEEMEERVDQMLPYGYVDLWISTFHAFCDKLLKQHALDIGLPNNYKLLDETEAWVLVRKNLDRFNLDYYRPLSNPTKFIHALLKHFSRCKDEGISPDKYVAYAQKLKLENDVVGFIKTLGLKDLTKEQEQELLKGEILRIDEVARAYNVYQQILLENDSLDFGDLISWTIELFNKRPLILEKYRQQFKYILVDEFQDTNYVQYELLKLLSAPKNNLTVVGDDDQSIYKFRGASISNIMQFKEDYPEAKEVVLTDNYRSSQEILDLSYKFIIQNNPYRLEEKLGIDKKLKSHVDAPGMIEHFHERTVDLEAQTVIRKIAELRQQEGKEWSDFAILVRANDSANMFITCLEKAQIPYQFLALKGLYNKSVVVDLINYLRLLDNYHESAAMYRILNFACFGLKSAQVVRLVHEAKKKSVSLFQTVKQAVAIPGLYPETLKQLNYIVEQIEKDTQLAQSKKTSEVLLRFLNDSGYLESVLKLEPQIAKEEASNIQQFYRKIEAFEASTEDARLADFMELMKMEMESGESGKLAFDVETGPDMVRIMTVHGSKGLEFDYVFLSNLVDRRFPTDQRREAITIPDALITENVPHEDFHVQEERRLFYVAMTRAKRGLYFTSADDYGGTREKKLSRFLIELDFSKEEATSLGDGGPVRVEKSKPTKTEQFELPKRYSYSQMQSYDTCPYKYKLANIFKIPTFGSHYFSFGSTIHNTLQKYLEQYFEVVNDTQPDLFGEKAKTPTTFNLEKLNSIYEDSWIEDWYQDEKQKKDYFEKGKNLLNSFYDRFTREKPNVKYLEQMFKLKIGDYTFTGRIDRVDETEKGLATIIDYKTGAVKSDRLSTNEKQQLVFYQIVAEEVLNLEVDSLQYHFLEADKIVSFLGNEKDKDKLKQKFVDNIHQIEQGNFTAKPSKHVCAFCEYKDICEFRK